MGCCFGKSVEINPHQVDLSHFDVHRVLGKGGFGKVNVVQSRTDSQYYAMKSIRKKWLIKSESNVRTVWLERHVMCRFKSPFLVNVFYAFQDKSHLYLVMRFMRGGDMRYYLQSLVKNRVRKMHRRRIEQLNKQGFVATQQDTPHDSIEEGEPYKVGVSGQAMLSEAETRFYMIELLLALEEIHSFALVYRDLKPDNILIDEQGHISVSDFGLCGNLLEEHDGKLQGNCGTKGYIAPEVAAGIRYNWSPDIYAYGVVMYEFLHGGVPGSNTDDPRLLYFTEELSPECTDLLIRLLQPDPEQRIGCDSDRRWDEIKFHPWFNGVNWEVAARRGLTPPFVPSISDDAVNCDPFFELEEQIMNEGGEAEAALDEKDAANSRFTKAELEERMTTLFQGWEFNYLTDSVFGRSSSEADETKRSLTGEVTLRGKQLDHDHDTERTHINPQEHRNGQPNQYAQTNIQSNNYNASTNNPTTQTTPSQSSHTSTASSGRQQTTHPEAGVELLRLAGKRDSVSSISPPSQHRNRQLSQEKDVPQDASSQLHLQQQQQQQKLTQTSTQHSHLVKTSSSSALQTTGPASTYQLPTRPTHTIVDPTFELTISDDEETNEDDFLAGI